MAFPLVGAATSYVKANWLNAFIGSSIGTGIVWLYDRVFGDKDKQIDKKVENLISNVENTPAPPVVGNTPSLISVLSEQNKIFAIQTEVLTSLVYAVKVLGVNNLASNSDTAGFVAPLLQKISDKDKSKEGFKPNISTGDTLVKDIAPDLTKPNSIPSVDNSTLASIASAVNKLGEAQLANNELVSAMNAMAINNSQRIANAITSGKMTAEVKNNVKVQNDVVIRRLEAELSVNKPVEVALPAEVLAYNKSMLEQKTKEVENSTKTYEIYKEQDTYQKTAQNIADLDGKIITNASPRAVALQYQATRAKTATDVNSFELEDTDIDTLFGNLPDITKIFDITLPSDIDREFSN